MMFVLLFAGADARAQNDSEKDEPKPWYERIDFGGDLRLRYEGFNWRAHFDDGRRDRFRYRFRVGAIFDIAPFLDAGVQLRSGNPNNPVSDNQTFGQSFAKDSISLSEAFAHFKLTKKFEVMAGKFPHRRLWMVSDMHWDYDVVIAGAFERFSLAGQEELKRFNLGFYQLLLTESKISNESYLFGFQLQPVFQVSATNEITLGTGFDYLVNPQSVADATMGGELGGNPVTNLLDEDSRLISDFRVLNTFIVWTNDSSKRWPVRGSFYWYKNFGASDQEGILNPITETRAVGSDNNQALFARIEVGQFASPGQLQFRFSYYDSEPDAIFYAYMQSDTSRASNVKATRVDLRLGMPANTNFNVTWYHSRAKTGPSFPLDRWQVDYIIRF